METGDARSLEPSARGLDGDDRLRPPRRPRRGHRARARGRTTLVRALGLRLPFFVKRGYHMHYEARGNAGLNRPVLDLEKGYVVTPMAQGLRLTTGAEFARLDDPPSPAHLERLEPFAARCFRSGRARRQSPGSAAAPACPTCARSSGRSRASPASGSTSPTTTSA